LAFHLPDLIKNGDINGRIYQKYEDLLKKTSEYQILCDLRSQNKFIIGMSIKPLKDINKTKEVVEKISNFINFINSRHKDRVHFVFFPFAQTNLDLGLENDMIPINDIINKIKIKNISLISHMNPILWYFLIGFTDIFIGMRFHSIIFAFINNKPFVAIPYENKIWNFIKENNCNNVLPLENFDDNYLIEFVEKELKGRL
jgi:polysaccharide pyruvyl transferase WcaK-like protein